MLKIVVGFCREMEVVLPLTSVFMAVIIGNMWGKRRSFREEEDEEEEEEEEGEERDSWVLDTRPVKIGGWD